MNPSVNNSITGNKTVFDSGHIDPMYQKFIFWVNIQGCFSTKKAINSFKLQQLFYFNNLNVEFNFL